MVHVFADRKLFSIVSNYLVEKWAVELSFAILLYHSQGGLNSSRKNNIHRDTGWQISHQILPKFLRILLVYDINQGISDYVIVFGHFCTTLLSARSLQLSSEVMFSGKDIW